MRIACFSLFDVLVTVDISAMNDGTRKSLCVNGCMMSASNN